MNSVNETRVFERESVNKKWCSYLSQLEGDEFGIQTLFIVISLDWSSLAEKSLS